MITEDKIVICGHGSKTPSTKNMKTYLSTRYNMIAKNKKHKGVVAVKRLSKMTDKKRVEFHDTYKIILNRNKYNQNLRNYVFNKYSDGNYYSDCSSSGMATLKMIGFQVSLLNTAGIYQSNLFEDVPVKIKDGHITNPEILKVGDAILFAGDDSSRPLQIGHVEWVYEMPRSQGTVEPKSSKTDFYPSCDKKYTSLVEALNSLKIDSSKQSRDNIAKANGFSNYDYSAEHNGKLLILLKNGKLIKP